MCPPTGPIVTKRMQCTDWSDLGHVSLCHLVPHKPHEPTWIIPPRNQNTIFREWGEWILGGRNMTITHNAKKGKFNGENSLWLVPSKGLCRAGTKSLLDTSPVGPAPPIKFLWEEHVICPPFLSCKTSCLFYVTSKVLLINNIHFLRIYSVLIVC